MVVFFPAECYYEECCYEYTALYSYYVVLFTILLCIYHVLYLPRDGIEEMIRVCFFRNQKSVFQRDCTNLFPSSSIWEFKFLLILKDTALTARVISHYWFSFYFSLMIKDVKHSFIHLKAIWISPFVKSLIKSFVYHFFCFVLILKGSSISLLLDFLIWNILNERSL